ncbi:ABC transporter ATP-binding protein [Nocardia arthritidis]|uniref:ATP-binding cassette domain-containing protein n=1 Tax=Nocardia arthritidis TaxID=228602 RepID=A0A6G9YQU3_9NOCA|nr:ABC transporter ATP-binding protein [Nocardia arthritidis]QIS15541.1 ATP-binding cassette domain-containing protein [Nocardia arthritidis]
MIELRNVRWSYSGADSVVLDGLDLRVGRGETVVLCGPSGSGKSSVLRLMNGLIPHFHQGTLAGEIRVAGSPIADLAQAGRLTGTVLQHPRRQFFTDAVDTELAFASENFGADPRCIRDRVGAVMAGLGLDAFSGTRLRELSGGQQQRVACAAAVTHEPPVLLLDEPTSNLSPQGIADLTAVLYRLRERGTTIVIAEHRLHYLRHLADRIVVLHDGRVRKEWSRAEFAGLTEETMRAQGLRSLDPPEKADRTAAFARGPSVATVRDTPACAVDRGVELIDIGCAFHGRRVLDIAYARLPAGVVTAVTGPNGAGKSTLARILAGLQRHSGRVLLDGFALPRRRRQRETAIVMQDVQRQLFTDSVEAELRLGTPTEYAAHAPDLLAELDLGGCHRRHPLSLSGGQQQRLILATARLSGRRIIVFDEPSSGVDRRHLRSMTRVMRDLAAAGAVVVLISHDADLLVRAADQELRLRLLR